MIIVLMKTKEQLDREYSEICARHGHVYFELKRLEKLLITFEEQKEALALEAASLSEKPPEPPTAA